MLSLYLIQARCGLQKERKNKVAIQAYSLYNRGAQEISFYALYTRKSAPRARGKCEFSNRPFTRTHFVFLSRLVFSFRACERIMHACNRLRGWSLTNVSWKREPKAHSPTDNSCFGKWTFFFSFFQQRVFLEKKITREFEYCIRWRRALFGKIGNSITKFMHSILLQPCIYFYGKLRVLRTTIHCKCSTTLLIKLTNRSRSSSFFFR